jgi:serine/threonine protein kinase
MTTRRDPFVTATRPVGGAAIEGTSLRVGDVLDGKYRILDVLGVGGMGVVVAATHVMLGQKVAIKLLLPHSLQNAVVVARFEREAKAAAALRSEHVARVADVGRLPGGEPFMVMELLEGSNLDDIVEKDGPLAPDVAVNYVLQACEAIAEAHALGIIHRDLKPHNLFLTTRVDGTPLVKVLDFGISKVPNEDSILTQSRDVMGSPLYMSPEQLQGVRGVDARSDLWALGAILFRLITGRTPFDGETMAKLVSRVVTEKPRDIRRLRPDIPDGLAAVIERCLRKDPAERYPDVATLAQALDPFAAHRSVRPAQRVVAASNRPPPPGAPPAAAPTREDAARVTARVPPSETAPPQASTPPQADPAAKSVATLRPLEQTNHASSRKRAPLFLAMGVLSFVAVGAALLAWRARTTPEIAAPATTSAASPSDEPSSPEVPAAPEAASSVPSPSSAPAPASAPAPHAHPRKPQRRSGPKPSSEARDVDDAPDIRK